MAENSDRSVFIMMVVEHIAQLYLPRLQLPSRPVPPSRAGDSDHGKWSKHDQIPGCCTWLANLGHKSTFKVEEGLLICLN